MFLLHAHPELQAGGTEIFARDLFRVLRANGATGIFLAGTGAHQRPASPGTPFQTAGKSSDEILAWTGGFDAFSMSQIDLHGLGHPLAALLAEQQPDIVHIHHLLTLGVETVSVVRRSAPNARIIMTLHDFYPICANDGQMVTSRGALCDTAQLDHCRQCFPERSMTDFRLRKLHIERAIGQIDHFIAPSRFLRDRYVQWGLPADLITVVPNGLPAVSPAPQRQGRRRDRFAFFGHINKFKGACVALDASAILSRQGFEHRLYLYGGTDHQSKATLDRFDVACSAAPDAKYQGSYRRSDFSRLVAGTDWVLFPSQWWENAPLVINEAHQHKRPVISSDVGGMAELVQDGVNGLHFPINDADGLAEAMRHAVEEKGLWQRLVDAIAAPISIEESATRHTALYEMLRATPAKRLAA